MLEVRKAGQNDFGIWVYGSLDFGSMVIVGIFKTDLTEIPKEKTLKVKKFKMTTSKKGLPIYKLEF